MLNVEAKSEAVMKRLDSMVDKIKTFGKEDMPQGLTDWQTEDMHRKYPQTEATQVSDEAYEASTMIYPRSRTYEQTHPRRSVAQRKPVARISQAGSFWGNAMPRLIKSTLSHPILRQVLFDMLHSRMVALLSEKIKWR